MKRILTHNGIFHADEVTAIALIKVFIDPELEIDRVSHNEVIENPQDYDFIIDIGQKYDTEKWFDHHHIDPEEQQIASAGLIWNYIAAKFDKICIDEAYPSISKFIEQVDLNDIGQLKADQFSIIDLIKHLNESNIYSVEQYNSFLYATDTISKYIIKLKGKDELKSKAKYQLECCEIKDNIIISSQFIPEWQSVLVGSKIGYFMWFDKNQNIWKVQVVPKHLDSFESAYTLEPECKNNEVEFVHNAKFFAVGSKEGLLKLIECSNKIKEL